MLSMRDSLVAFFAAAMHVIASIAMLVLLRRGLPGFPDEDRIAYMAVHRAAWIGGWLVWQIAAVSLLAFYAVLALRFRGVLSATAMAVAAGGIAIDFACEARYMGIMPELRGAEFAALDRELEVLIGYGANGLYTLAMVLVVVAGVRVLPGSAVLLAGPVAASGIALAVASLEHDPRLETITSAVLFPLFTLWLVMVGLWLRRSAS